MTLISMVQNGKSPYYLKTTRALPVREVAAAAGDVLHPRRRVHARLGQRLPGPPAGGVGPGRRRHHKLQASEQGGLENKGPSIMIS